MNSKQTEFAPNSNCRCAVVPPLLRTKSTESDIDDEEACGDFSGCSSDTVADELTSSSDDSDESEDDGGGDDGLLDSGSSNRDAGGCCDAVNDMARGRGFHRSDEDISACSVTETLHSTTRHISVTLIITTETDLQRLRWLAVGLSRCC